MAGTATVLGGAPALHRSRGVVRIEVALACDASGVISAAQIGEAWGRVVACFYDGGLDASAVITVSDARTGATLFTYTTGTEGTPTRFIPTTNVVDNAGATIAAADTAPNVWRPIKVAGKVNLAVASGGVSETGKFVLVIDETTPTALADRALTV